MRTSAGTSAGVWRSKSFGRKWPRCSDPSICSRLRPVSSGIRR